MENDNPKTKRRVIHVINPTAGKGVTSVTTAEEKTKITGNEMYISKKKGDAGDFIRAICASHAESGADGEIHFIVYGGDGTIYEAVNGIMKADAGKFAVFSAIPSGSGNDFVRGANRSDVYTVSENQSPRTEKWIDVIAYTNERGEKAYSVNMLNVGFDCSVAAKASEMKMKPLVSGSTAYILGVLNVLFHKKPLDCRIEMTLADGNIKKTSGKYLLTAIGNSMYCGGGFRAATAAKLDDGLLDVLIVDNIPGIRFVSLANDYHAGAHADKITGEPIGKFKGILTYRKCTKVSIYGISQICADGEIEDSVKLDAEIIPRALRYAIIP